MSNVLRAAPRHKGGFAALIIPVVLEAALVVTWSGGFIGIRFATDYAPIFLILLWRSLVSGLVLLPFALTVGPRLRWRGVVPQMLFGYGPIGCQFWASCGSSSSPRWEPGPFTTWRCGNPRRHGCGRAMPDTD